MKVFQKGQTALEVLIIMGILILVAIIFGIVFISTFNKNSKNDLSNTENKIVSDFNLNLNEYEIPAQPGFNFSNKESILSAFIFIFLFFIIKNFSLDFSYFLEFSS